MKEFDEKAATWDDDPKKVDRALKIGKAIKQYFKGQSFEKGLEYGSGTGLLGFELSNMVKEITLMDQSSEMIKIAKKKQSPSFKKITALQYDLLTDPLPNEKYDFIVTLLTMHHIEDTETILRKFNALLNDGGILAIIDLEKEDGSFHDYDFDGHLGFDKEVLESQLIEADLKPTDYFTIYTIKKESRETDIKEYPLFISIAEKA
jgi:predicted TPR repeat methyltransferase